MKTWKWTVLVLAIIALGTLVGLLWYQPRPEPPLAEREVVNPNGMRLVRIPAGEFFMGCEEPVERLLGAFPAHHNYTADYWSEEYPRHVLQTRGYHVMEAGNGKEALRVAEDYAGPIHLLATDVVMPNMGGRLVAEQVAALKPGVKVLFLSGYTDDAVVRHGVLSAEMHFLQKPFTPSSLAQKVRDVLDTSAAGEKGTCRG